MEIAGATGPRPAIEVAVVMRREAAPNRWEAWRHGPAEVLPHEAAFGAEPALLRDDGRVRQTLHPGFRVELFKDECEGYYLNLSSGAPVWFVMWRSDDEDGSRAWPETVSLSYNEAGRWLDAQEHVDNLPLPPDVCDWLQAFNDLHYRPEPKRRNRPASFKSAADRGP
jgi:hypothetical protein